MSKRCSDFPIGSRVTYRSEMPWGEVREVSGTVVKHYPGYLHTDEETGDTYRVPDHVSVRVDSKPKWWAYGDRDRFAPRADELLRELTRDDK